MDFGLSEFYHADGIRLYRDNRFAAIRPAAGMSADYVLTLPVALPGSTQALTLDSSGNIGLQAIGGGGSVTSVGLSLPSIFTVSGSPVTTSGTLSATLASQTAGQFFAAPAATNGAPAFRSIAFTDVSSLVGTSGTSIAVGNDSRFHTQNTDTGTTQASFQLNSGASGVRIANEAGTALRIRNAANSADADLICGNLIVNGTTTTISSETLTINDNIIVLNNNVSTGVPTEDGGFQVRRGASIPAAITWGETPDQWLAGLAGSELPIARTVRSAFTSATLVSGVLTVTHSLGQQFVQIEVYNSSNRRVNPDNITCTSATQSTIDLTSFANAGIVTGTWNVVVVG